MMMVRLELLLSSCDTWYVCRALLEIIKACKGRFVPCINQEILTIVFGTLTHSNRFVREMSFYLCGELSSIIHQDKVCRCTKHVNVSNGSAFLGCVV